MKRIKYLRMRVADKDCLNSLVKGTIEGVIIFQNRYVIEGDMEEIHKRSLIDTRLNIPRGFEGRPIVGYCPSQEEELWGILEDLRLSYEIHETKPNMLGVFVSRDKRRFKDLTIDNKSVGQFLGYPTCCIKKFIEYDRDSVRIFHELIRGKSVPRELYFSRGVPCGICEKAMEIGRRLIRDIEQENPEHLLIYNEAIANGLYTVLR